MKVKRYKRVRRIISFYHNNFAFTQRPYKVLIDGTFCQDALENRINLREQVPKYLLQNQANIFTTNCVLKELELLGKEFGGALFIARQFPKVKCDHEARPVPAAKCILSLVRPGNEQKFWVGSQDRSLTESLQNIPGCPVMYIKYNSLILDNPSPQSLAAAAGDIESRIQFQGHQKETVDRLKEKSEKTAGCETAPVRRKRKGPKGPNPLSCKKKKLKLPAQSGHGASRAGGTGETKKRKRKRRRKNQPAEPS